MLTLWFALGFIAKPETTEPPVETITGGGTFAADLRAPKAKALRRQRNREEIEALLLASAI